MDVTIRPFRPDDQVAARSLILEGLGEHFGAIDETRNPDLDDIASAYARAVFLVAEDGGRLVGTGALVPDVDGIARVVRMSVERNERRRGVGLAILDRLLEEARARGRRWIALGTTTDWEDANGFYRSCGFAEIGRGLGAVAFALDLKTRAAPSRLRSWALLVLLLWRRFTRGP